MAEFTSTAPEIDANDRVVVETVRVRILPDGRMTREDAALYLGMKPKTLAMWDLQDPAKLGGIKVGGRRFYFLDRLKAFVRGETA